MLDELTGWFIAAMLAIVAVYDIWTIRNRGVDTSISRFIRYAGSKWPMLMPLLAAAAGALYGHFFL